MFAILECQNTECRFRFSVDLTAKHPTLCPTCKSRLSEVEARFESYKVQRQASTSTSPHVEVMLDNIRSTFNVGAMFRSCDGAQVSHVHLCGTTPTPDHPKIKKTGLGAEYNVPWSYYRNGKVAVEQLKNNGYQVWCLEGGPNAIPIFNCQPILPSQKILLVVGNEVTGIDPGIINLSDKVVFLPMLGTKESLNVAIAFGIAVYFLRFNLS
jgi:tRNA G18 (ribose-2'-O)-methylase SpoU